MRSSFDKAPLIEKPLSLNQREAALKTAMEKGLSAEELIQLGHETGPDTGTHEKRFARWATVATIAMVGGGLASNFIRPDINVPELMRQAADLIFTPGNAPVAEATLKTISKQLFQWGIYFGESAILIGVLINGIKSRITKSDQLKRLSDLQVNLKRAVEAGEAPIPMPKGYAAINLGIGGDAIGRAIGKQLGWGKDSLPLSEGEANVSGFPAWIRLPNPSGGIEPQQFFEGLDRANFQNAATFVLCPVKENQAFLPDPKNQEHFDLRVDEIMDRINLSDEYCRERNIPQKQIIIICDENVSRTVGPYVEGESKNETYTLRHMVEKLNESRLTKAKIVVADPTDIVLRQLSSPAYNPKGLALEFFEDQQGETYGARFVERCRAMGISVKTTGDPSVPSLKVAYGIDDLATRGTTARLDSENTVAVIIDSIRAVGTPYISIIVADVVKESVLAQRRNIESPNT